MPFPLQFKVSLRALSPSLVPIVALLLKSPSPSSLNPIIAAFSRSQSPSLALRIFSLHHLAFPSDSYSLCSSLTAAAAADDLYTPGTQIHALAFKSGHLANIFVCGALLDFHAKSGNVDDAHKLFDEIPVRNAICVNSLMNGYIDRKRWSDGLCLFQAMGKLGIEPSEMTLGGVVKICAEMASLDLGMQAHASLVRRNWVDVILLSLLVEMYGKCGLVGKARFVFELAGWGEEIVRDLRMWTSMLNAYSRNGMFKDVIRLFERMLVEGRKLDEVVFLVVLSVCGRSGNVVKGMEFWGLMKEYALVPGPEHYGCVVDMLCKAGELDLAWEFVTEIMVSDDCGMVSQFGVSVWGAILSACRNCGNVEIGKIAASKALEFEPDNVGIYMELSNLYARVGMWDEIVLLRQVMKEKGLKKHVGFSWLERATRS